MITLNTKLDNPNNIEASYMLENLARVKINILADGTVTVELVNDDDKDLFFIKTASLSSGLAIKQ